MTVSWVPYHEHYVIRLFPLVRSKGCSHRTNDLTRQPAVTDRQKKKKKRYPGLAHVISGMFYSVVANRRQSNLYITIKGGERGDGGGESIGSRRPTLSFPASISRSRSILCLLSSTSVSSRKVSLLWADSSWEISEYSGASHRGRTEVKRRYADFLRWSRATRIEQYNNRRGSLEIHKHTLTSELQ